MTKYLSTLLIILLFSSCQQRPVYANSIKLSEHFCSREFACHHCGQCKVNMELVIALEKLRKLVNVPIIITSGYRCPIHNKTVGGVKNSQHLFNNAVDVKIKGYSPMQVTKLAKQCGFIWIKAYPTFTHIDIRRLK